MTTKSNWYPSAKSQLSAKLTFTTAEHRATSFSRLPKSKRFASDSSRPSSTWRLGNSYASWSSPTMTSGRSSSRCSLSARWAKFGARLNCRSGCVLMRSWPLVPTAVSLSQLQIRWVCMRSKRRLVWTPHSMTTFLSSLAQGNQIATRKRGIISATVLLPTH